MKKIIIMVFVLNVLVMPVIAIDARDLTGIWTSRFVQPPSDSILSYFTIFHRDNELILVRFLFPSYTCAYAIGEIIGNTIYRTWQEGFSPREDTLEILNENLIEIRTLRRITRDSYIEEIIHYEKIMAPNRDYSRNNISGIWSCDLFTATPVGSRPYISYIIEAFQLENGRIIFVIINPYRRQGSLGYDWSYGNGRYSQGLDQPFIDLDSESEDMHCDWNMAIQNNQRFRGNMLCHGYSGTQSFEFQSYKIWP